MAFDMNSSRLSAYRNVQAHGSLSDASPHRVIQVMLQTAMDRLSEAKGHMERNDSAEKGRALGKVLAIVEALRLSLDPGKGGELAAGLDGLYEYVTRTLLQASAGNDRALLDEAAGLLGEIKSGWDGIAPVD